MALAIKISRQSLDQKVINKFIIIILSYKRPFVIIADSDFAAFRLNNGSHYI